MDIYSSSCIFLLFSVIIHVFILGFFIFVIHSSISLSLFKFEHTHWTYEQNFHISLLLALPPMLKFTFNAQKERCPKL